MKIFDQIRTGGFADPTTLQGAVLYATIFAFLAWLVGRALRLVVQRVLLHDKHDHVDRMAFKFLAKLTRYCVYVFAFVSYAHLGISGVVLTVDVWCADALTAIALKCDLLEQATKRFALEGIGIPLPQMTVVLKNDRRINGKQERERTG